MGIIPTHAVRSHLRRVSVVKVDDSGSQQLIDINGIVGDSPVQAVYAGHHGFSSNPPVGSEGLTMALGSRSDRLHLLGLEHQQYRPRNLNPGETVIYDAAGQAVSLVQSQVRIVGKQSITLTAPKIILAGTVYLGGADAANPASMKGTVDSGGNTDQSNLAQKVFVE